MNGVWWTGGWFMVTAVAVLVMTVALCFHLDYRNTIAAFLGIRRLWRAAELPGLPTRRPDYPQDELHH